MRNKESDDDVPENYEKDPRGATQVLQTAAEDRVQADGHEGCNQAVQAVVKQLPQWRAGASPPSLLPIRTIYNNWIATDVSHSLCYKITGLLFQESLTLR